MSLLNCLVRLFFIKTEYGDFPRFFLHPRGKGRKWHTRPMCWMRSKLTINTPKTSIDVVLVSILLTLRNIETELYTLNKWFYMKFEHKIASWLDAKTRLERPVSGYFVDCQSWKIYSNTTELFSDSGNGTSWNILESSRSLWADRLTLSPRKTFTKC